MKASCHKTLRSPPPSDNHLDDCHKSSVLLVSCDNFSKCCHRRLDITKLVTKTSLKKAISKDFTLFLSQIKWTTLGL